MSAFFDQKQSIVRHFGCKLSDQRNSNHDVKPNFARLALLSILILISNEFPISFFNFTKWRSIGQTLYALLDQLLFYRVSIQFFLKHTMHFISFLTVSVQSDRYENCTRIWKWMKFGNLYFHGGDKQKKKWKLVNINFTWTSARLQTIREVKEFIVPMK